MQRPLLFALAIVGLAGSTLAAQDPQPPGPAPKAQARAFPPDSQDRRFQIITQRRARFGVSVNIRARSTDSVGAYINGVTPGGPAAKAGIKSGDIITRVNGQSLVDNAKQTDHGQSAPGLELIEFAAKLEPNDTVAVEFRRGAEKKTVTVVTADEPMWAFRSPDGAPGFAYAWGEGEPDPMALAGIDGPDPMERIRVRPPGFLLRWGTPLADLEVAPINPDLGRYFGVTEGILIIDVPDSSSLNLKPGDVVLSVGGREPSSPSHLLRILRSYDPDEDVKIEIMRMKKKETIVGTVGDGQ